MTEAEFLRMLRRAEKNVSQPPFGQLVKHNYPKLWRAYTDAVGREDACKVTTEKHTHRERKESDGRTDA